jgi:two-component system nitrogen regulation sensor histidine kinase NtrY
MPAIKREPGDLNALIREVVLLYKTLDIQTDLHDLPECSFDPDSMKRVFINLIENAGQAMTDQKDIVINSRVDEHNIQIDVMDSGHGIPPDVIDKIFEPYFSTRHRGMGLGLAIVQRIVHEHGGTIDAQNREQGGALFRIVLSIEKT